MKMKKGIKKLEQNNAMQKIKRRKNWEKREASRIWNTEKMQFVYN